MRSHGTSIKTELSCDAAGAVAHVRAILAAHDKPENKLNYQRFFKEKLDDPWGLKSALLRKICDTTYAQVKGWPKENVFACCEMLLASGSGEERGVAFSWALKMHKQYEPSDFARLESWLAQYVKHWASHDSLCCGPLGQLIFQYPALAKKTRAWTKSDNRWFRRASAVSLILSLREGLLLEQAFWVADKLLIDPDDMVQKGYGWTLKEASNRFPKEVFDYVMKNKDRMPRTALRYAIEKLPPNMKGRAMR